jgi:hypothetical protein
MRSEGLLRKIQWRVRLRLLKGAEYACETHALKEAEGHLTCSCRFALASAYSRTYETHALQEAGGLFTCYFVGWLYCMDVCCIFDRNRQSSELHNRGISKRDM